MPERGPSIPDTKTAPDTTPKITAPSATALASRAAARRTGLLVTFLLGALTATPPLALGMYLPSLPAVTESLHAPAATVQLTLTACLAGMALGQLAVGQINGKVLVGRVRLDRVLVTGLLIVIAAATALLLMSLGVFGEVGLVPVAAALFVLMSAMGISMPNTQALALMRVKRSAGSASALLGTTSFLVGAVASPLVGIAGEDTAVPMAVVQLVAAVVALGLLAGMCRPPAGRGGGRGAEL